MDFSTDLKLSELSASILASDLYFTEADRGALYMSESSPKEPSPS